MADSRARVDEVNPAEAQTEEAVEWLKKGTLEDRQFQIISDDCYRLKIAGAGVELEFGRARWSGGELCGELVARCRAAGSRTVNGTLLAARFNATSLSARKAFAKELAARARVRGLDWHMAVEQLCISVLDAQRNAVDVLELDDVPVPNEEDAFWSVDGLRLLRHHPNLIFAPGGASKSYLALWIAGRLAEQGLSILYVDTESDAATHRARKARLFGERRHRIYYHRTSRPLAEEADALRRVIVDRNIDFLILDSVSCAADSPLEESQSATKLYQVLRRLDVGCLLLAHTAKGGDPRERTAFGSSFYMYLARRVWSLEKIEDVGSSFVAKLRLVKSNFGAAGEVRCFRFTFEDDRTEIRSVDPASVDEAAVDLPIAERIAAAVRLEPKTRAELAEELGAKDSTIRQAIYRDKGKRFVVLPGGRIALREDGESA